MVLDYEIHTYLSVLSPTLGGSGWLEGAGVGYFLPQNQLGSGLYPNSLRSGKIVSPEGRPC